MNGAKQHEMSYHKKRIRKALSELGQGKEGK